jgi:hypothetical protein
MLTFALIRTDELQTVWARVAVKHVEAVVVVKRVHAETLTGCDGQLKEKL